MDHSCQQRREVTPAHHQTRYTSQDRSEQAGAFKAQHCALLNRHDSGFEEVCRLGCEISDHMHSPNRTVTPSDPAVSTIRSDVRFSEDTAPQRIAQRKISGVPSQQGSGQEFGVDLSINLQRPRSTTPSSCHRSTITKNSLPSSNTSSRQSSATSGDKSIGTVALRGTGAEYDGACSHDALTVHPEGEELFMPLSTTRDLPPALSPGLASQPHKSPKITPVSFPLRRRRTASLHSVEEAGPDTLGEGPYHFENFVPASCIDWTQPATRQRQYRKIDQSSRGLRGLWRRLTPRWCHGKGGHLNFFREGDKEDASSVRRYRVNIAENGDKPNWEIGEDEAEEDDDEEEEFETKSEHRPSIKHRLRRCLSFSREQEKKKTVELDSKRLKGKTKGKAKVMGQEQGQGQAKGKGKGKQTPAERMDELSSVTAIIQAGSLVADC